MNENQIETYFEYLSEWYDSRATTEEEIEQAFRAYDEYMLTNHLWELSQEGSRPYEGYAANSWPVGYRLAA